MSSIFERNERRHLTLLELLVVFTLVVMLTGVISFGIQRVVQQQSFITEVDQVVEKIRLAQNVMLIRDGDAEVVFTPEKDGILLTLEIDAALPKRWMVSLDERKQKLEHVRRVYFEGIAPHIPNESELRLSFLSGGSVMSHGILWLVGERDQKRGICLYGYPHPIASDTPQIVLKRCQEEASSLTNEQLTLIMREEILE